MANFIPITIPRQKAYLNHTTETFLLIYNTFALRNKKTKNQSNLFINFNNLEAHVQPLPELKEKLPRLAVYTSLFQGARHKDDERVFRKRFDFEAQPEGQKIITKGLFDCLVSTSCSPRF